MRIDVFTPVKAMDAGQREEVSAFFYEFLDQFGLGLKLMNAAMEAAKGDIALHVEPENPAGFLYEKLGFTSKYKEMRLVKS